MVSTEMGYKGSSTLYLYLQAGDGVGRSFVQKLDPYPRDILPDASLHREQTTREPFEVYATVLQVAGRNTAL